MNREEALTYLNLINTAPLEVIEDALEEEIFALRNYFLMQYPLRSLFQKRADKANQLVTVAAILEIPNTASSSNYTLPEAITSLSQFEAAMSVCKQVLIQSGIRELGSAAMQMVAVQEMFENYVLLTTDSLSLETSTEVKIGFPGDFMQFRACFSKVENGKTLSAEESEVVAKEVKRIQGRLRLQSAR